MAETAQSGFLHDGGHGRPLCLFVFSATRISAREDYRPGIEEIERHNRFIERPYTDGAFCEPVKPSNRQVTCESLGKVSDLEIPPGTKELLGRSPAADAARVKVRRSK